MGLYNWLITGEWKKPIPYIKQLVQPLEQEPIGNDFVDWIEPGKCPDCGCTNNWQKVHQPECV